MRAHLGPPRELLVRRSPTAQYRAKGRIWSAAVVVLGLVNLVWAAAGVGGAEVGVRVARVIVAAAAIGSGVLDFRAPTMGRLVLTIVLTWTTMMALVVWR